MPIYEIQIWREAMVAAHITITAASEEEALDDAKAEGLDVPAEDWYVLDHEFYKDRLDMEITSRHN